VELAEEREGAACPEDVGEEARLRPQALAEAAAESLLDAASGAEAGDLLASGVGRSGGELLQR